MGALTILVMSLRCSLVEIFLLRRKIAQYFAKEITTSKSVMSV
jgi:hypothetical protein